MAKVQRTLLGAAGPLDPLRAAAREAERAGIGPARAAGMDEHDALWPQQMWGLFDPARTVAASTWQLARCSEANVFGRTNAAVGAPADALGDAAPARLEVFVMPCDPASSAQMVIEGGAFMFGTSDTLVAAQWPSEGNFERWPMLLARAIVRVARPLPARATLADHLAREGLASAFAGKRHLAIDEPWLVPFRLPAIMPPR